MATLLRKHPRSPYWMAVLTMPDGKRTNRSTKTSNKIEARRIANEWQRVSDLTRNGIRIQTESVIRDILSFATGNTPATPVNLEPISNTATPEHDLTRLSFGQVCGLWLEFKRQTTSAGSYQVYCNTVATLQRHIPQGKPMTEISKGDAQRFITKNIEIVSAASVNKTVSIAKILWKYAIENGHCVMNPWQAIPPVKGETKERRAFTIPEIDSILKFCNPEWRGMVLAGIYTGQRLGDIASLTWRQVDIENDTINFRTTKTGKYLHIPMAGPLHKYLTDLTPPEDLDTPVFPTIAGLKPNTASRQFVEILGKAGLREMQSHKTSKGGRGCKRETGGLSFHCLRHTATSMLKNAGVSDVVAREIIGHDSVAISRTYTHIETPAMQQAIGRMPVIVC